MRTHSNSIKLFWLLFAVLQISGWIGLVIKGRDEVFFALNGSWGSFFDLFFYGVTYLAEWPGIFFTIALIFLTHRPQTLKIAMVFSLNGILSYILKTFVFGTVPRPAKFYGLEQIFVNPMMDANMIHSFPSGHTFTAFAGFTFLIFVFRNTRLTILFFTLACVAGLSRIYNGQHFPEDVLMGAALGTLLSYVVYAFVPSLKASKDK